MRHKISIPFLIAIILLLVISQNKVNSQPSQRMKSGFYIGANGGFLYPEYYFMYNELGFKTNVDWGYSGDWQPWASWMGNDNRIYGGFFDVLNGPIPLYPPPPAPPQGITWLPDGYLSGAANFLTRWGNNVGLPHTAFYRSSKIDKPCFGQRSTYQTEYEPSLLINAVIKPGYGYLIRQTGSDYKETWMGEEVSGRVCHLIPEGHSRDPVNSYIVKQLYENNEQTNVITRRDYSNAYYSDRKRMGDNFKWYVKPRMRIDSAFTADPDNLNKRVVRVEIFNYDSVLIKSVDIKVRDFKDTTGLYNGKYIEMYNFKGNPTSYSLSVPGDSLATGNIDTSAYYTSRDRSRIDYRIYWYGEVDVWLDYVRLDDEWAHFLFTDPDGRLPGTINKYRFGEKIKTEVQALSNLPGFGYFYFDEFYYNNIPCVKEVLRLIKYYNPDAGMIFLSPPVGFTGTGHGAGIKNELTLEEMYDYLGSQGLYTDFVANDAYPIFDNCPIPPNLNKPNPLKFPGTIMYGKSENINQYDDYINMNVLSFDNIYRQSANVIKNYPGTVFVATIQVHTVETNFLYCACDSIPKMERKREPTNEEISLQAYYALTFGARQIHYYTQFSGGSRKNNCPGQPWFFDWGLTYFDTIGLQRKRDTNYYGQHKWNYIQKLDSNLNKIGKYMYESNDLKYENTISINKGERYKYISDLKSYYRNPSASFDFSQNNIDSANKTYWEIGFFNNYLEPDSKYFLLLNKRCAPEIRGGDGDLRTIRLFFNSADLAAFRDWELKDIISGEKIVFSYDNISNGIYFGFPFQPGEGKLLRLAPK